jgi:hypothetical protein
VKLPTHTHGEPESRVHRWWRESAWRLHWLLTWRLPKRMGRDRCAICGVGPCGAKLQGEWRCSQHSVWVSYDPAPWRVVDGHYTG